MCILDVHVFTKNVRVVIMKQNKVLCGERERERERESLVVQHEIRTPPYSHVLILNIA